VDIHCDRRGGALPRCDPVLVDVDPATLNIDLEAAAAAITSRTKAIMPVHFAGLAVDRQAIASFAETHGLKVVEDAAHAFTATSAGDLVGKGSSEAVVFSFYATKTMTTGEGGMVVTPDDRIAARIRTMRLHGISSDALNVTAGRVRPGTTRSSPRIQVQLDRSGCGTGARPAAPLT